VTRWTWTVFANEAADIKKHANRVSTDEMLDLMEYLAGDLRRSDDVVVRVYGFDPHPMAVMMQNSGPSYDGQWRLGDLRDETVGRFEEWIKLNIGEERPE